MPWAWSPIGQRVGSGVLLRLYYSSNRCSSDTVFNVNSIKRHLWFTAPSTYASLGQAAASVRHYHDIAFINPAASSNKNGTLSLRGSSSTQFRTCSLRVIWCGVESVTNLLIFVFGDKGVLDHLYCKQGIFWGISNYKSNQRVSCVI